MKICIFGYAGGMGRRYRAILEHLGHEWAGVEPNGAFGPFLPSEADAIIIASSTDSHAEILRHVKDWGRPVLCEKPVTKDRKELEELMWDLKKAGTRVQMVNQYDYMPLGGIAEGDSLYDYWNSGKDGLAWDCIQVLYHARGKVTLQNKSPIWTCRLNGNPLSIADMDGAYVTMIQRWLVDPQCHYERILEAHEKVHAYLEAQCRAF